MNRDGRSAAKLLTKDVTRRIAVAKLPDSFSADRDGAHRNRARSEQLFACSSHHCRLWSKKGRCPRPLNLLKFVKMLQALEEARGDWVVPYLIKSRAEEDRSQRCRLVLSTNRRARSRSAMLV